MDKKILSMLRLRRRRRKERKTKEDREREKVCSLAHFSSVFINKTDRWRVIETARNHQHVSLGMFQLWFCKSRFLPAEGTNDSVLSSRLICANFVEHDIVLNVFVEITMDQRKKHIIVENVIKWESAHKRERCAFSWFEFVCRWNAKENVLKSLYLHRALNRKRRRNQPKAAKVQVKAKHLQERNPKRRNARSQARRWQRQRRRRKRRKSFQSSLVLFCVFFCSFKVTKERWTYSDIQSHIDLLLIKWENELMMIIFFFFLTLTCLIKKANHFASVTSRILTSKRRRREEKNVNHE